MIVEGTTSIMSGDTAVTSDLAREIMQFAEREVCVRSQHAHTVFGLADELLMYHMITKIPGD
jgi:hypothetical protein